MQSTTNVLFWEIAYRQQRLADDYRRANRSRPRRAVRLPRTTRRAA